MVSFKFAILLIITLAEVDGEEIEFPVNLGATVGDTATMHCAYMEKSCFKIKWQKRLESGMVEDISDGSRVYDDKKYRLDVSSACDLVIEDVQPSDFGVFICNISGSANGSAILFELPKMGQSRTKSKAHNKPPSHKQPKTKGKFGSSGSNSGFGYGSFPKFGFGSAPEADNQESQNGHSDSEPDNPESESSSASESSSGSGVKVGVIVGVVIGVVVLVIIVGIVIYCLNK